MEPWKIVAQREIVDQRPWLRVWLEDVQLPDGRLIEGYSRIETPSVAVVVALTMHDEVVFERGYKHGTRRVCWTLPGGHLEPDEDALTAAQRELLEETGYISDSWISLGDFVTDSNRQVRHAFLFMACGAHAVQEPDAGDLEQIEVSLMPLAEAVAVTRRGEVADVIIAAAIGLAVAVRQFDQS